MVLPTPYFWLNGLPIMMKKLATKAGTDPEALS